MKNPEWKWFYASLVSGVFFTVLFFTAQDIIDCMEGGCAIMFVSIFLALTSFAVAILFFTRARLMDDVLSGKNVLAHWTYPEEETRKNAEREYASYRENNMGLLLIVSIFMLIAMAFMAIFMGEAGLMTAAVLLVVLLICAVVAVAAPWLVFRRALRAAREAYISDRGVIYEGSVYPFRSFLVWMTRVSFVDETPKHPSLLVFSFFQIVGYSLFRTDDICIPVPRGEEDTARRIAEMLGRKA